MLSLNLMKQSSIARRLLLWFLILALLPMIILAYFIHGRAKAGLMIPEKDKLTRVADFIAERLVRSTFERTKSVMNLARLTDTMGAVKSFNEAREEFEVASNSGEYEKSEEYKKARDRHIELIKYLEFITSQYNYRNIYFISMKGDIVASIKPHPILGKNLENAPYSNMELTRVFKLVKDQKGPPKSKWENVKPGWAEGEISDFRPFPDNEGNKGLAAFIVSPIRYCANNNECDEPHGVLAVQMPEDTIKSTLDSAGISDPTGFANVSQTSEVLIGSVDSDKKIRLLNAPKLKDQNGQTILHPGEEIKGLQEAMQKVIKGDISGSSGSGDMTDYRGKNTIAAWKSLPSLGWVVVAKMDKDEADQLVNAQLRDMLWLGGVMILVVIVLAFFVARSIYGPIGRLTKAVRLLPSGDFRRRRVPVEGSGEIGELSRALNNAMDEVWLLQYISNEVNEAKGVEAALQTALKEVCDHTGMLVGHVYDVDRARCELISSSTWHLPDPDRFRNFRRVTENMRLKPGVGLPGQVLQSGQPEWVEDVKKKDGNSLPELAADDIEVRGGFAFPVLVGKEVTGVLEFFTDRPVALNRSLLRTMTTVGTLLGRAIERKREDNLLKEKTAAEAANQAKSEFIASVSHDLRTPLNAILGYSEMHYEGVIAEPGQRVVSSDSESLGAEGRSHWEEERQIIVSDLRKINNSGKNLLRIINNVLDLSRAEAGKMTLDPETFDVVSLAREVVDMDEPHIKDNGNRVELDCSDALGTMHADKMVVKRILSNLLSNAQKFTKQGVIRLSVERRAEAEAEWMIFCVSDTGIGMTQEQQGRIFESFTQAERSTKSLYGGTGLGLTISKNFCQIMGGDISVESELGRGTTFTVRLPTGVYAPRQEDTVSTGDLQVPPEGATVVLVIDDDPAMRELTKHFLGKEGFHVEAAASGEDGLRLARKLHPDVITLDVVMPGMDGYSVVSALMADEELRDIPVVMLTIVDEKSHGFPQGVADYMKKPIDWERLTALLNKYRYTAELACTVLVIDDNEMDRELLKRTLEKDGWEVETAENGRIGLEQVERRQPDLILLDLDMPEMNGYQFVKALRREPRWATIPIAIITAKDITFEDRIRLGGCVEKFLEKGSYTREDLLREVRDLVSACARPRPVEETTRS